MDVILIHGTLPPWRWWSRVESARQVHHLFAWTDPEREGSLAARIASLQGEGGAGLSLTAFPWRGSNAASARDEAARRLANLLTREPERPKLLVAHSHGGNVAIRALQHAGSPASVRGLVCLATPFLQILIRDPNGILWLRSIGLLSLVLGECFVALGALGLCIVGVVGAVDTLRGQPIEGLSLPLCGLLLRGGAVALGALVWFHRRLGLRGDDDAERVTLEQQREALGDHAISVDTPCLCVHPAGDEAGGWLGLASIVSGLSSVLRNRFVASVGVLSLAVLAATIEGLGWHWSGDGDRAMRMALNLALWLAVGAGAYFLLTALALALTWGFEALPFTFGSRSRSWHLTQTAVSLTPLYARNVEFRAYAGTALLLHSIYSSPSVQADVVGWLGRRLGLRSMGASADQ